MPGNYKAVENKADRMGPGGSRRPRNPQHASATSAPAASRNEEHEFEIVPYRKTFWRTFFFIFLSISSFGVFRLFLHWLPKKLIQFRARRCLVENADLVLVVDNHGRYDICDVHVKYKSGTEHTVVSETDGSLLELEELRWFKYRKLQYSWIDGEWSTPSRAYSHVTPENLTSSIPPGGLNFDDVALRRTYFGMNAMPVKLTPFYEIMFKEVLSPFYIFQAISVTVWYIDDYVWYAALIIVMSLYSVIMTLRQTRSQQRRLQSMVVEHDEVQVIRENGRVVVLDSSELVPGDVLVIPTQGCMMYCDCVLLNGSVIVNESMLTGESIPITKSALSDDGHEKLFSMEKHGKHVIFNGTKVLQTKYYKGQHVKALVLRTAYSTTKGQLIRAIMYPKPADFKFFRQLMKFIGVLSIVASIGFLYTAIILIYRGNTLGRVIIRALDLVTIVVPPALPAVMGIGIFYAQRRLRQKSIYCISPTTINTCGAIDVVCFDKTGTLTEDGLDFYALRVVENGHVGDNIVQISADDTCQNVVRAIATCHSLSKINHELHGDPLDVIMFEQTGYSLEEDDSESHESIESIQPILVRPPKSSAQPDCQVVKQFTFSSGLQRQSVIATFDESLKAYCKGSPEMIMSLCTPDTVPDNFHDIVEEYSQHGYRLIAIAEKDLNPGTEVQKIGRQSIECDLKLIGLVALENRLKPVTTEVIQKLNEANIRSVMVTGDNLLTALSVARECGIIDSNKTAYLIEHENSVFDKNGRTVLTIREKQEHSKERQVKNTDLSRMSNPNYQFAISGPTFAVVAHEHPNLLNQLVCVCNVFARMAPEQKQLLVEHLQDVGTTVAMCGDGANDCAALKAAHAGISLSDSEASIAAPFTSKVADIRCVITLISEGRAALVTSYSAFLCMAGYSLTQFISILLLYWISTSYSQMQFLFIDIAIVTNLAFFSSKTRAHKGLASSPPPTSILSTASMVSLFGQLAIGGFTQVAVFCLITMQYWFVPFVPTAHDNDEDRKSMQGTAIFYVSMFHYIVLYFVFAAGPPYRASVTSNKAFLMSMIGVTISCVLIATSYLPPGLHEFLGCVPIDQSFRYLIVVLALLTAIVSIIYDRCVDWISERLREKIRQQQKRT